MYLFAKIYVKDSPLTSTCASSKNLHGAIRHVFVKNWKYVCRTIAKLLVAQNYLITEYQYLRLTNLKQMWYSCEVSCAISTKKYPEKGLKMNCGGFTRENAVLSLVLPGRLIRRKLISLSGNLLLTPNFVWTTNFLLCWKHKRTSHAVVIKKLLWFWKLGVWRRIASHAQSAQSGSASKRQLRTSNRVYHLYTYWSLLEPGRAGNLSTRKTLTRKTRHKHYLLN